jgi:hypothetical protein
LGLLPRARGYASRYLFNRLHQERLAEYGSHVRPMIEAVAHVTGCSEEKVRAADDSELMRSIEIGHSPVQPDGSRYTWVVGLGQYGGESESRVGGPIEAFYGPSPEMMGLVSLVCRLLRPEHVVETGVAKGFTSTAALDALDRNGRGQLHSVELPGLYVGFADQVGERIPQRLRHRWTLEFGPSAVMMPKIMRRIPAVDVFVHDSAANYDNQRTEFGIALDHMAAGSALISDMLNSDAFLEATESTDCRWSVINQSKDLPIGLLCKLS